MTQQKTPELNSEVSKLARARKAPRLGTRYSPQASDCAAADRRALLIMARIVLVGRAPLFNQ